MAELERKFRTHADHVPSLREDGYSHARSSHQIDSYFIVNKEINGERVYFRLREDKLSGINSLDYHVVKNDDTTDETESDVADPTAVKAMMSHLGFEVLCVVDKKREVYEKAGVKVALDTVPGLGRFIEVEIMGVFNDQNIKRLDSACAALGLEDKDRVYMKGYPDLLMEKTP